MVSKYGAERYNSLPTEEIERYKQQYKEELDIFHKEKEELIRNNPELKAKRKPAKPAAPRVRKPKEHKPEKEETTITPFKLFYQDMKVEREMRYQEAQQMYKNLGDAEKMAYINKVIALDTPLDKMYTSDEKKIMKHSTGMPIRPLSAYNTFVKVKNSNKKMSMKVISELWKNASEKEKKTFHDKYAEECEQWQEDMMAWIKKLPAEQQAEHIAKNKLFKVDQRKRKRDSIIPVDIKIEETNGESVIRMEQAETSPKKKKKNEETLNAEVTLNDSPKKDKIEKKVINELNWESVFNTAKSSSPKKESFEKTLANFGPYPSLTTAHYFMTEKCMGKSAKKTSKAYKHLSRDEKKKLYKEMIAIKEPYIQKLMSFAAKVTDQKHQQKILEYHRTNKTEQESNLAWHIPAGTDNSSSSDDDDDDL